jgi:HD-GYP domain-containing protein (c-di-GMP phosphodiesterase class II)
MDFSPEETKDLVLGAFLLDIGHMMLDRQLASHSGRYSVTDRQKMKRHPQLGYEILKGIPGVSPAVLQAVLFHHERYNGEGYYQMPYENLPLPPKIVGACDMYDALTSARPYRAAFSPAAALKILLNSINIHFDYKLVHSFINRLGSFLNNTQSFYTVNDICELNSRELALVIDIETEDFLRPRVMVFCRFEKHEGRLAVRFHDKPVEADLVQDGERYITRILDDKRQIEMIGEKLRSRGLLK